MLLAVCLSLVTLNSALAHDIVGTVRYGLSGVYELKDVTAAGIYSEEEANQAQEFLGHFLTIHGEHVVLPTSELCHVASKEKRTLKDDRESFGTAGGSWSEIGLQKTSKQGYGVTEIRFDCDGPFHGMLLQPETDTYVLQYWSVYIVVGRESD